MKTISEKRSTLAPFIEGVLHAIDAQYVVDERIRAAVIQGRYRRDRLDVMGDPTRYCMLMPVALEYSRDPAEISQRRGPQARADAFSVQLWHAFEDAPTFEDSSQAAFEQIIDGEDGLLRTLARTPYLEGAGELGAPVGAKMDLVALGGGGEDLAHYLTFTITVT